MILPTSSHWLTRRRCLQWAAVAAASPSVSWAAEDLPGYIDAHVHVWTSDTTAYPLGSDYDKADMVPASFTPEELFAECRPAGVKQVVLIQMNFYQYDNRYMLDAIARYPETFRGVAIIDEEKPRLLEAMQDLKGQGVSGYRLYANAKATALWLESASMATMWKNAVETGQAICLLADPDALPSIEKMCRKFPQTKVVIDHFGRIGIDGTIRQADVDQLCKLAAMPNTFIKTSAFYALGKKQPPYVDLGPMIKRLRDSFGAQRLMWASDCPYQVQDNHSYAASVELISDRLDFLTEEDKQWMLRKTAQSVYWL